jgi:hypothetical protein
MEPVATVETKTEEEEEEMTGDAEDMDDYYDVENGGATSEVAMTEGSEIQWSEEKSTTSTANLDDIDDEAANDNYEEEEEDQLSPMHAEFMSSGTSNATTTNTHDGPDHPHHHFGIHHHQHEGERGSARRISLVTDLSTGKAGGARVQNVRVRSSSLSGPQTASNRLRNSLVQMTINLVNSGSSNNQQGQHGHQRTYFKSVASSNTRPELSRHGRYLVSQRKVSYCSSDESDEQLDLENGARPPVPTQYCLRAVRKKSAKARFWAWLGISDSGNVYDDLSGGSVCSCFGLSPNTLVARYLHWTFRSSFSAVFLSGALVFLSLTMLFATFTYLISLIHPTCIGGVDSPYFTDVFVLSWTTFSTVGYGA